MAAAGRKSTLADKLPGALSKKTCDTAASRIVQACGKAKKPASKTPVFAKGSRSNTHPAFEQHPARRAWPDGTIELPYKRQLKRGADRV
jgi:hypothetical protein